MNEWQRGSVGTSVWQWQVTVSVAAGGGASKNKINIKMAVVWQCDNVAVRQCGSVGSALCRLQNSPKIHQKSTKISQKFKKNSQRNPLKATSKNTSTKTPLKTPLKTPQNPTKPHTKNPIKNVPRTHICQALLSTAVTTIARATQLGTI
jgi:hypothetical protein